MSRERSVWCTVEKTTANNLFLFINSSVTGRQKCNTLPLGGKKRRSPIWSSIQSGNRRKLLSDEGPIMNSDLSGTDCYWGTNQSRCRYDRGLRVVKEYLSEFLFSIPLSSSGFCSIKQAQGSNWISRFEWIKTRNFCLVVQCEIFQM